MVVSTAHVQLSTNDTWPMEHSNNAVYRGKKGHDFSPGTIFPNGREERERESVRQAIFPGSAVSGIDRRPENDSNSEPQKMRRTLLVFSNTSSHLLDLVSSI